MSDIDLIADARAWLATQGDRIQTHGELCHRWHPACLVSRLLSRSGQSEAKTRDFDADVPARDNAAPAAIACDRGRTDKAVDRPAGTGDTPEAHATQGEDTKQGRCTLTAEEREAIAFMLRHAAVAADGEAFIDSADYRHHHDAVLGLLGRASDGANRQ